jgi:hypothetical protein
LKYNQSVDANTANELLWNYKYYDNFSLGFNASIGLNYRISDRFSLFTELSFLSQSFSPKKGEATRFSISGVNQLNELNEFPYFSKIEFGDEYQYEYANPNNTNNDNPQKLYRRSYDEDAEDWVNINEDNFFKEPYRTLLDMGSDVQGGNTPFQLLMDSTNNSEVDKTI